MDNKRIKMIKLRNDQSRIEVAQKLSITSQMLGAIERGDRTPSLELAKKIAELYKTTIDDLFLIKKETKRFLGGD
ncbi:MULTISPECIES: helix-turn-helix transcriptional regulator [Bacillus]|uniref:helix-turn-helix transcriptional regulator n=1 Tax=Bacillus TaxID=1386 RepID=UPI0012987EE4|nr:MULTISPECIES: helix-turn-helix domain-containing protein [Bacillus]MRB21094.1 helix-turn-helix domain-containing protein [Bacillus thuringiensis]MCU4794856.1 helix-turn-helix domain-containing protein [Bacillus cereus]MDA1614921.1 helix-turn-helix domain-containing protein [Bacillus cereus]MDF9479845.1 helix-turn-helix domain-containing protein [Bacillus cereus]MDF9501922.1 helix-turn-helix domain-containing protein [Bacillus cereus]